MAAPTENQLSILRSLRAERRREIAGLLLDASEDDLTPLWHAVGRWIRCDFEGSLTWEPGSETEAREMIEVLRARGPAEDLSTHHGEVWTGIQRRTGVLSRIYRRALLDDGQRDELLVGALHDEIANADLGAGSRA